MKNYILTNNEKFGCVLSQDLENLGESVSKFSLLTFEDFIQILPVTEMSAEEYIVVLGTWTWRFNSPKFRKEFSKMFYLESSISCITIDRIHFPHTPNGIISGGYQQRVHLDKNMQRRNILNPVIKMRLNLLQNEFENKVSELLYDFDFMTEKESEVWSRKNEENLLTKIEISSPEEEKVN